MHYICTYKSPLGDMLMAADEVGLAGLWFEGQKYFALGLHPKTEEKETPALSAAKHWLDLYFAGEKPDIAAVPLHLIGTDFQKAVWNILCEIPYGGIMTYSGIAKKIAEARCLIRMPAQAVGGAVSHNPISVIVPCHRVIGADGSMTGYAGGIDKKIALLSMEGAF